MSLLETGGTLGGVSGQLCWPSPVVTQWLFDKLVLRCVWNVNNHQQHKAKGDTEPKKLAVMPRCTPLVYFMLSLHVKFATHYFHTFKAQVCQLTTVMLTCTGKFIPNPLSKIRCWAANLATFRSWIFDTFLEIGIPSFTHKMPGKRSRCYMSTQTFSTWYAWRLLLRSHRPVVRSKVCFYDLVMGYTASSCSRITSVRLDKFSMSNLYRYMIHS